MKDTKEYKVLITETLQKAVIVEAASEPEAHRRTADAWKNGEYILDADSFQGVEFHVAGEADGDDSEKELERIDGKNSVIPDGEVDTDG